MVDIEKIISAAQAAGAMVVQSFRQDFGISHKGDRSICTQVDLDVQTFLIEQLKKIKPEAGFLAEEASVFDLHEYTWVIDPIDGTRNFARGLHYFGINIALMHHNIVVAAVTYMPTTRDLAYAQKGMGSWFNGKKIMMSNDAWMKAGALMSLSTSKLGKPDFTKIIRQKLKAVQYGVSFRVHGAVAVDLAYTAGGMFDIIMVEQVKWWDVAAGILLVQEAGGFVSSPQYAPGAANSYNLVAGNQDLCALIMSAA